MTVPTNRGSKISIHALREEGDPNAEEAKEAKEYFYPRPPRGGRHECFKRRIKPNVFLSTPSARRATHAEWCIIRTRRYFYPRPPRGGRQDNSASFLPGEVFLSTPSARRATLFPLPCDTLRPISIHALREEGDPA